MHLPRRPRTRLGTGAAVGVALALVAGCAGGDDAAIGPTSATSEVTTTAPPATSAGEPTSSAGPATTAPSSTDASTTTTPGTTPGTTPETTVITADDCLAPSQLPPMVAADIDGYDTVGVHEGLGSSDERYFALFSVDGAVATQVLDEDDSSVEWRIGRQGGAGPSGLIEHAILHDLVVTPSGPAVLYSDVYQGDAEPLAYLYLLDLATGTKTEITTAQTPEYFVYRAMAGDGVVVTSAYSDLTEDISTWAIDGSGELDRYTPVLAENYGKPPFYGPAIPSPDGTRLAWLEGPDVTGDNPQPTGSSTLFVADAVTGKLELSYDLGPAQEQYEWFDWDGRWAILSRGEGLPALALDTQDPTAYDICGDNGAELTGLVTLVVG